MTVGSVKRRCHAEVDKPQAVRLGHRLDRLDRQRVASRMSVADKHQRLLDRLDHLEEPVLAGMLHQQRSGHAALCLASMTILGGVVGLSPARMRRQDRDCGGRRQCKHCRLFRG